jgi:ATP adenylyltransferase
MAYVSGTQPSEGCIFCAACGADRADESLVVYRGEQAFIILNLFPYNSGHVMVVPRRHFSALGEATPDELVELMELTRRTEAAIMEVYAPQGLNIGINLGRAAGAGVLDHLHIHVVPRWNGDTNFMTVVGEARVLPETLEQSAERLRPVLARLAGQATAGR